MNFKEHSLTEYIEYTIENFAKRSGDILLDAPDGTDMYRSKTHASQSLNNVTIACISTSKNDLSIDYGSISYRRSYSEESLRSNNVSYTKDLLCKRISKKSNSFYTKYYTKNEVTAYKQTRKGSLFFKDNGVHKIFKINTVGTSYFEKYTSVSEKLVESCLANNKISITMSKTLSGKVGKCRIKRFIDRNELNFNIEGEPCVLRLMNNTVIFNALMDTELGTYIEEVRELIRTAFDVLKKTPIHSTGFDSIVEFYKNNAD